MVLCGAQVPGETSKAGGLALAVLLTDAVVFDMAVGDGGVADELAFACGPFEPAGTGFPYSSRLIS